MNVDFATLMELVAPRLLGEPNSRLSKPPKEWRFGNHGSTVIDLENGIFFDHEANTGGGVIDLIIHKLKFNHQEATLWLRSQGFLNGHTGPEPPQIIAEYDYTDEEGEALFQVVRYMPKAFRQRRRNGSGDWIWNVNGVRRVLYRLPQLIEAIACEHPISFPAAKARRSNARRFRRICTSFVMSNIAMLSSAPLFAFVPTNQFRFIMVIHSIFILAKKRLPSRC